MEAAWLGNILWKTVTSYETIQHVLISALSLTSESQPVG